MGREEERPWEWGGFHPNYLICWIVNVGRSDACTASRVSWFAKQASYADQISRSFPHHVGTKWRSHKSDICWYRCTGWQSQGEFLRCKRSEFYAWTTCLKKYSPLVFALNFYVRRLDTKSCLVLKNPVRREKNGDHWSHCPNDTCFPALCGGCINLPRFVIGLFDTIKYIIVTVRFELLDLYSISVRD